MVATDIQYDRSGNVVRSSNPYKPSESVLWTVTDYDILGRVRKVTGPDNTVSTNAYSRYASGGVVARKSLPPMPRVRPAPPSVTRVALPYEVDATCHGVQLSRQPVRRDCYW